MTEIFAVAIGVLGAISFYLITSKNLFRILLGLILIGQSVHLYLFSRGGLHQSQPALIDPDQVGLENVSDPLIQALILTAIVISFAIISFAAALFLRNTPKSGGAS